MLLNGKKVFVGRFVPRKDREIELGEKAKMFTNVFIKNLPEELDESKLTELFEKYGQITSLKIMKGDDGKSKGFGFVSYEDPGEAEAAVEELNNKDMDGKTMYVGRAQKKAERQAELKKKFEALKMERMTRYFPCIQFTVGQKIGNSWAKKLVRSNKSISRKISKFHILEFEKWPKINF